MEINLKILKFIFYHESKVIYRTNNDEKLFQQRSLLIFQKYFFILHLKK